MKHVGVIKAGHAVVHDCVRCTASHCTNRNYPAPDRSTHDKDPVGHHVCGQRRGRCSGEGFKVGIYVVNSHGHKQITYDFF